MLDHTALLTAIHDLTHLAQEARQRGDERQPGDIPPRYWLWRGVRV